MSPKINPPFSADQAGSLPRARAIKDAVLGRVTSKSGVMETRGDLRRRIDEAAKYAPLNQLCLSPQCGFASTEEGNTLGEAGQWAKLRLAADVAREVWG